MPSALGPPARVLLRRLAATGPLKLTVGITVTSLLAALGLGAVAFPLLADLPWSRVALPVSATALAVALPIGLILSHAIALNRQNTEAALRQAGAAAEQARRAQEAAERADRVKSAFLANMSHELRTPLNAVIGFSEIIKDDLFGPAGQEVYRDYARDIHESGRYLLELVNNVLDLAKIEAGQYDLKPKDLDLAREVAWAMRLVQPRADRISVRLVAAVDPALRVRADHRSLRGILLNLLANAVKFNRPGGAVIVRATLEPEGGLALSVADTGHGIAAADLPRVLTRFGRADEDAGSGAEGTGLGLPIVQALATLHGAAFRLDSEVGRGTTASVVFPAGHHFRKDAPADTLQPKNDRVPDRLGT